MCVYIWKKKKVKLFIYSFQAEEKDEEEEIDEEKKAVDEEIDEEKKDKEPRLIVNTGIPRGNNWYSVNQNGMSLYILFFYYC